MMCSLTIIMVSAASNSLLFCECSVELEFAVINPAASALASKIDALGDDSKWLADAEAPIFPLILPFQPSSVLRPPHGIPTDTCDHVRRAVQEHPGRTPHPTGKVGPPVG